MPSIHCGRILDVFPIQNLAILFQIMSLEYFLIALLPGDCKLYTKFSHIIISQLYWSVDGSSKTLFCNI